MRVSRESSSYTSALLTNTQQMKKLIICVPDEMAALVREWKKWIPEMTIIQEETVVDQPKRVKEKGCVVVCD